VDDDEDFVPEDPIGPVVEKKPILNRLAVFVVEYAFTLIIITLAAGLGLIIWLLNQSPRLSPEQIGKVQIGMTRWEVEKALGFKSTGPALIVPDVGALDAATPIDWKAWEDGKMTVIIGFADGQVKYVQRLNRPQR
jgi:hypothetical protein